MGGRLRVAGERELSKASSLSTLPFGFIHKAKGLPCIRRSISTDGRQSLDPNLCVVAGNLNVFTHLLWRNYIFFILREQCLLLGENGVRNKKVKQVWHIFPIFDECSLINTKCYVIYH